MLNVLHAVAFDTDVVKYQYHIFKPYNLTAINENDEIRIAVQGGNSYCLPSESFIAVSGQIQNDAGNAAYNGKVMSNGLVHLFQEVRIEIGGIKIDSVRNPGMTSALKGICSYNSLECRKLQNASWAYPGEDSKAMNENGKFNIYIPLKHILGFAEDFNRIILNTRIELVLHRARDSINVTLGDASKIKLDSVSWVIPIVDVSDVERLRLTKVLEKDKPLQIAFRSWQLYEHPQLPSSSSVTWQLSATKNLSKPRYVIVGFQTDRQKAGADNSKFDLCGMRDVKLYLNSEKYPYHSFDVDADNNRYGFIYEMYSQFQSSYYQRTSYPLLKKQDFTKNCPIFVIDCSKQNEFLKDDVVSIRLELSAKENIPNNTKAFCLIIHDREVHYNPLSNIVTEVI